MESTGSTSGEAVRGSSLRTLAVLALTAVCVALVAWGVVEAARQIRVLESRRDAALAARADGADVAGNAGNAFRSFRATLGAGERFTLVFAPETSVDDQRGTYRLVALSYLYPAVAVDDLSGAEGVMVFGEPSTAVVRHSRRQAWSMGSGWDVVHERRGQADRAERQFALAGFVVIRFAGVPAGEAGGPPSRARTGRGPCSLRYRGRALRHDGPRRWTLATGILVVFVLAAAGLRCAAAGPASGRSNRPGAGRRRSPARSGLARPVAALSVGVLRLYAATGLTQWDGWAMWAPKAHALYLDGDVWGPVFATPPT